MLSKFILAVSYFLITSTICHSQSSQSLSSSTVQNFKTDEKVLDKVTTGNNQTYVFRLKTGFITIDHFDDKLALVKTNRFSMPKHEKIHPLALKTVLMDDKIVLLAVAFGVDYEDLLALPINMTTLEPGEKYTALGRNTGYAGNKDYQFSLSPNKKYLAISTFSFVDNEAANPSHYLGQYDLLILNSEISTVSKHELIEYSGSTRRTIKRIQMTDAGDLIVLVREESAIISRFENYWGGKGPAMQIRGWFFPYNPYKSEAETKAALSEISSQEVIMVYPAGKTTPRNLKVNVKGKTITDLFLSVGDNGEYMLAGYYSDGAIVYSKDSVIRTGKDAAKTINRWFRRTVNGAFYLENASLDKDIEITNTVVLPEPIIYPEVSMIYYDSKHYSYPINFRRSLVIKDVYKRPGGVLRIASEIIGERSGTDLSGAIFYNIVVPFVENLQVIDLNINDNSCTQHSIIKRQMTYQEPLQLLSYTTVCPGGGKTMFYNEFTIDSTKHFNAFGLLTLTHKKLIRYDLETFSPAAGNTTIDAALKGYYVFTEPSSAVPGCKRPLLFFNEKGYKLVRFE